MRRTDIGYALSGLIGLGITAVGTQFLLAPTRAAAEYGISVGREVSSADPYLSVKGVRDVASGLMTFVRWSPPQRSCSADPLRSAETPAQSAEIRPGLLRKSASG